jgi:alkylated DNA repair dioxygenase AlkB
MNEFKRVQVQCRKAALQQLPLPHPSVSPSVSSLLSPPDEETINDGRDGGRMDNANNDSTHLSSFWNETVIDFRRSHSHYSQDDASTRTHTPLAVSQQSCDCQDSGNNCGPPTQGQQTAEITSNTTSTQESPSLHQQQPQQQQQQHGIVCYSCSSSQQSQSDGNGTSTRHWNDPHPRQNQEQDNNETSPTHQQPQPQPSQVAANNTVPPDVFGLNDFPGFFFLPQYLTQSQVLELSTESLQEYCEPPHATNLDQLARNNEQPKRTSVSTSGNNNGNGNGSTMWQEWIQCHEEEISIIEAKLKKVVSSQAQTQTKTIRKPQHKQQHSKRFRSRLDQTSWATMGYHYNWTERSYCDEDQSAIPIKLEQLSKGILDRVLDAVRGSGAGDGTVSSANNSHGNPKDDLDDCDCDLGLGLEHYAKFQAQACIVNYYKYPKSVMGGHLDDLELDLKAPVVSVSMGLPALFLLGQHTKGDNDDSDHQGKGVSVSGPVVPIMVRSGDVMVMGGDSRLRYHGMARVLPHEYNHQYPLLEQEQRVRFRACPLKGGVPEQQQQQQQDELLVLEQEAVSESSSTTSPAALLLSEADDNDAANAAASLQLQYYLSTHRININIRQVLPDQVHSIADYHHQQKQQQQQQT